MADVNTDQPDLLASTGNSDSSSPWNGLLFSALQTGVNVGSDALTRAIGAQTPLVQSNGAPPPATSPNQQVIGAAPSTPWYIWALGLVGLGLVAYLIFGRR
jgi:hypothetical protein